MAACRQRCSVILLVLAVSVTALPVQEKTIDEIIMAAAESREDLDMIQVSRDGEVTIRMDGDMDLTPLQWKQLYGRGEARGEGRAAIRDPRYLWPNNTVVYEFEKGMFDSNERRIIESALKDWERYTCLKFRPATPKDKNKILIVNYGGCSSWIGCLGGTQRMTLSYGCVEKHVVLHEFGHAIGFHHEQSRPDRDDYVTIVKENIHKSALFNFQKMSGDQFDSRGVPYDYLSLMHYGARFYAIDPSKYTIITKDPAFQEKIGTVKGLSFRDIKGVNLLYKCSASCALQDRDCPGEGFVGKDCQCWCPGNPYTLCDDSDDIADVDDEYYEDDTDTTPEW